MIGFRKEAMKHRMIVTYFLVLERFSSSIIFLLLTRRLSVLKNRGNRMEENIVIIMMLLKLVLKSQIDWKPPTVCSINIDKVESLIRSTNFATVLIIPIVVPMISFMIGDFVILFWRFVINLLRTWFSNRSIQPAVHPGSPESRIFSTTLGSNFLWRHK